MHVTSQSRPIGPRSLHSSTSPLNLETTSPLNIRKNSKDASSIQQSPAHTSTKSPTPSLGLLSIPNSAKARPTTPKGIKLSIPIARSESPPLFESYYGGPSGPPLKLNMEAPDDTTIRPPLALSTVTQKPVEPIDDINQTLCSLNLKAVSPSQDSNDVSPIQWSDDSFEELSRLGEGAGGAVHKVKAKRSDKIMARKTITTREAPMKQLLRELSIISSTEHVNIILFYGAYMSPSSSEVKILMEFCEGGSLEAVGKRIKDRSAVVGEKIAGRLAEGILQGLNYLHTKKTIHRDIKPSNILLSREGIVKLCDFGVSGELVDSMAGTFTGTSFYMAPERICGREYTIRSDVWSTGISLLELAQNRFPFPNDLPPIELMMHITNAEPPRLDDEPGVEWSEDMKDFIKATLTVDALSRPTPKEMLSHPWIVSVMKQEVHMARWIRQVWDWPKPASSRKSRDNGADFRPPSSHQITSITDTSSEHGSDSPPKSDH